MLLKRENEVEERARKRGNEEEAGERKQRENKGQGKRREAVFIQVLLLSPAQPCFFSLQAAIGTVHAPTLRSVLSTDFGHIHNRQARLLSHIQFAI